MCLMQGPLPVAVWFTGEGLVSVFEEKIKLNKLNT